MSTSVRNSPCPHPGVCGARSHVAGSSAADLCAARASARRGSAAPPPPPLPSAVLPTETSMLDAEHRRVLGEIARGDEPAVLGVRGVDAGVAALESMLAERDAAQGWDPRAGLAHPSGGYTGRSVRELDRGDGVELIYTDELGRVHRTDGPAQVAYDVRGHLRSVEHWQANNPHCDRGACDVVWNKGEVDKTQFYVQDPWPQGSFVSLNEFASAEGVGSRGERRHRELVALGADAAAAVKWMTVERSLHQRAGMVGPEAATAVADMVAGDLDPEKVLEAMVSGVHDLETLTEVGRGSMPLSWAAAGL